MNYEVLSQKSNLQKIANLIKTQTYLYPRLHSSNYYLIKEILRNESGLLDNIKVFNKMILQEGIFNESIHEGMKSATKLKYLHIGLRIVESILSELNGKPVQSKQDALVR